MSEYIEREAVMKVLEEYYPGVDERLHIVKDITSIPAADVAEVRHGRWIVFDSENPESKECTACGYLFSRIHPSNYCPYCGALMDGKEDEHEVLEP